MVDPEEIVSGEWADWYRLTPLERWHASGELWEYYRSIGASLDPEPDTESPFYYGVGGMENRGRKGFPLRSLGGMRVLRRGGVWPQHGLAPTSTTNS